MTLGVADTDGDAVTDDASVMVREIALLSSTDATAGMAAHVNRLKATAKAAERRWVKTSSSRIDLV